MELKKTQCLGPLCLLQYFLIIHKYLVGAARNVFLFFIFSCSFRTDIFKLPFLGASFTELQLAEALLLKLVTT